MGYLRGLIHGALAGGVLAFLYAPDSGMVTRRRLSRWLVPTDDRHAAGRPAEEARAPRRRSKSGEIDSRAKRP